MKRKDIEPLILDERDKQDAEWGGTEHDKEHKHTDWLYMIYAQVNRCMTSVPGLELGPTNIDNTVFKDRIVKIAALCYAALEAQED